MSSFWYKSKSLFSSLLQPLFDFMTLNAPETLFPQQPMPVESYEAIVAGTNVLNGKDKEAAKNYFVKEIRLYKCKSHPYHEYLIIEVTYRNHSPSAFLRVERTRTQPEEATEEEFFKRLPRPLAETFRAALKDAQPENTDDSTVEEATYPPPVTPSSSSSQTGKFHWDFHSPSSASLKTLNGKPAVDTVISVNPDSLTDDDLWVTLEMNHIPLAQLACLAKIVHDEDPIYSVFRHQCYWYANLIMKVIEKDAKKKSERRVVNDNDNNMLRLARARGTWWRIPVGKVEKKMVEMISEKFKKTWDQRMTDPITSSGNAVHHDFRETGAANEGDAVEENPRKVAELTEMLAEERRGRAEERRAWEEERRAREEAERRLQQALQQQAQA
ncbi:hypothetical protein CVT26_002849 [Gymnopilus dilepis]|uniref:Uncharacterized protein n=1 Tax=Gymnopilus dilepis TaxID=231916 RepID=A0A409Y366_9AGAR|nr:hypothetical protein CVT26_002849 [Gymnopilus dilepis]